MKFIHNKKVMSVLLNEAKYLTGLFGGFNLAALAILSDKSLNWLGEISTFLTAISSVLLIVSTYLIAALSGFTELKDHPDLESEEFMADMEPVEEDGLVAIGYIWMLGIIFFFSSLLALCLSIGWGAAIGFIASILIVFLVFKYKGKIHKEITSA